MKKVAVILILSIILLSNITVAQAQTPIIQILFDPELSEQTRDCEIGQTETLYIVAKYFNYWLLGFEFAIDYPANITWLADIGTPQLTIGSTPVDGMTGGISFTYSIPQNGFFPILLMQVLYTCDSCPADTPIRVVPHGQFGFVRATRFPDTEFIYAVGMTSLFCPVNVPVEDTTWGQIKVLYNE